MKIGRLLLGALFAWSAATAATNSVRIETGLIEGTPGSTADVHVFRGISYAAPPVGDLRWRPPEPAAEWNGVRPAREFSHACVQDTTPGRGPKLLVDATVQEVSEDCLYLNVWTTANSAKEKRPVIVYFHGGGLAAGAGNESLYNGEGMAKKGVVFVVSNYRVGVLGFLAYPELTKESQHHSSGNYGFLDQIAALRWVQKNIAAFGGDPQKVTIMGQSGGSRSVNTLMASPLAKGLFQRVISESHAYFAGVPTLAEAEEAGLKFAQAAGTSSLAQMRAKPFGELVRVQLQTRFQPNLNVDGYYMPADIYTMFATGRQNDVPLIAGSNSDESSGYAKLIGAEAFIEQARRRYGSQADVFLKFYPAGSDDEANRSRTLSGTDQSSSYEARAFAQLQSRTGKSKAFLYRFSHKPPLAGPDAQVYNDVFHGAELYYVLQQYDSRKDWAWTSEDRKLGDLMSTYWVNFARTGNPNGKGLPNWPSYDEKADTLMNFGDQVAVTPVPRAAALDFFEKHFHPVDGGFHSSAGSR